MEDPGIDPGTSRMLSERSTIWANPPTDGIGVPLEVYIWWGGSWKMCCEFLIGWNVGNTWKSETMYFERENACGKK